ncbi:hypothetical protein KsCSTR_11780 [Candidatus Kuenenia stuttgartiensis]|uniref:Uncharacterized protein n=1 Tax=Kuenenia stuttgartiensis TaxID=174633 RepID=Q1PYC2_KUEST|nr:hypothetical protein KsCSTR_11780 [Candidatus Kuenenia stuttgartiensis]CAJ72088.1 unknown protein [Candidatus Kuenenia stuttgartiensis]
MIWEVSLQFCLILILFCVIFTPLLCQAPYTFACETYAIIHAWSLSFEGVHSRFFVTSAMF